MLIKNALVFTGEALEKLDVLIENGTVAAIAPEIIGGGEVINGEGYVLSPGFIDLHVHLREPGFTYKETLQTGTAAAAKGGYTTVCAMPNLDPFPDTALKLQAMHTLIQDKALVNVLPYGCITVGEKGEELAPITEMAELCCAFSDDGKGVQNEEMMRQAMRKAEKAGKVIAAHCEVESLLNGGYVHEGAWAKAHGHAGISSASETVEVQRNIALSQETGAAFHMCHISAKESVQAIAWAKSEGLRVTCEVTPHHILQCDEDITQDDGRFKMNPPLRAKEDRAAIIAALQSGTIDAIATDHAPHSHEEKAKGLAGSAMGVVGLETAFGVLNEGLVKTGVLPLEKLLHLLTFGPAKVLGLPCGIAVGAAADLVLLDVNTPWQVDSEEFLSMGKASSFEGYNATGKAVLTLVAGVPVYTEVQV